MGEVGRGQLTLDDSFSKQAFASVQVFAEELKHDVLDVGDVYFVDDAIDALSKSFPCHFLILGRVLVSGL